MVRPKRDQALDETRPRCERAPQPRRGLGAKHLNGRSRARLERGFQLFRRRSFAALHRRRVHRRGGISEFDGRDRLRGQALQPLLLQIRKEAFERERGLREFWAFEKRHARRGKFRLKEAARLRCRGREIAVTPRPKSEAVQRDETGLEIRGHYCLRRVHLSSHVSA